MRSRAAREPHSRAGVSAEKSRHTRERQPPNAHQQHMQTNLPPRSAGRTQREKVSRRNEAKLCTRDPPRGIQRTKSEAYAVHSPQRAQTILAIRSSVGTGECQTRVPSQVSPQREPPTPRSSFAHASNHVANHATCTPQGHAVAILRLRRR